MSHSNDNPRKGPLERSWYTWIDEIEQDPTRAWEGLYRFAQMFFTIRPPQAGPEDREDLMADVVDHFRGANFTVLKKYRREKGRPFANWFGTIARNKFIDGLRKPRAKKPHVPIVPGAQPGNGQGIAEDALPRIEPQADDVAALREALRIVAGCMDKLPEKQQRLLEGASMGLKPQELTKWMGWPPEWNKKASDDLREARKQLIKRMIEEGIDPEDVFLSK